MMRGILEYPIIGLFLCTASAVWVAYVPQGGVGYRVSNGFGAICLPTYLQNIMAIVNQLYTGGNHFTIYMPPQLAQYSYLPTYLPKKNGGRDARTHPTLGDIRNPAKGRSMLELVWPTALFNNGCS